MIRQDAKVPASAGGRRPGLAESYRRGAWHWNGLLWICCSDSAYYAVLICTVVKLVTPVWHLYNIDSDRAPSGVAQFGLPVGLCERTTMNMSRDPSFVNYIRRRKKMTTRRFGETLIGVY